MSVYARIGIAILACYGAGLLGSLFMTADSLVWYDSLVKPFFTPPAWLFAPVWLVLYGCMSAALAIVWSHDPHASEWRGWVPLFLAHLTLNAAWTAFFFGFHVPLVAFVDILALIAVVSMLVAGAWEIDKRAAYLLLPYLAWISFAALLNISIWYLN
jgi:tryptophan-rich sensory protein